MKEKTKNEIDLVKIQETDIPLVNTMKVDDLEQIVNTAEKQIDLLNKIKVLAIKLTNANDWVVMGKEPYLEISGTTKIRERFGINISFENPVLEHKQDKNGEYIVVQVKGKGTLRDKSIEDVGVSSSRDKFFGRENGKAKEFETIDQTNIIKKAVTNLQNRLIKKILGFYPTFEELELAGIKLGKVTTVSYETNETKSTDDDKQKQLEICKMLLAMSNNDKEQSKKLLKDITKFKAKDGKIVEGVEDTNKLKGIRLNITLDKIRTTYDDFIKNQFSQEGE